MEKQNLIQRVVFILRYPNKFFAQVKKEKGLNKIFMYYLTFTALSLVINFIVQLPSTIERITAPHPLLFIFIFLFLAILIILVGLSSFPVYALYHLIIKAFKGRKPYRETYKLVYAATPLLVVQLVPFYSYFKPVYFALFIVGAIYALYLEYVGLIKLQGLSKKRAIGVIVIVCILSIVLILILNQMLLSRYSLI